MSKPTESISRRDEIQSLSNGILKCIPATSTYPSQKGLQFGERLLNGREIGRVGRQEQETTSSGFNGLPHARPLMNAQVIQDHDLPWFQTGSKKLFHIELKSSAIRRPIQQECGSHSLQRQGGHQCHIGSIIAGHFAVSSLSSGSIGVQRGHGNVGAGLIHKHQIRTGQVCCLFAPGSTFGFLLLAGSYGLFFPWGQKSRRSSGSPALLEREEKGLALVTETKARELLPLCDGGLATKLSPAGAIEPADVLDQLLPPDCILFPPLGVGNRAPITQQIAVPIL